MLGILCATIAFGSYNNGKPQDYVYGQGEGRSVSVQWSVKSFFDWSYNEPIQTFAKLYFLYIDEWITNPAKYKLSIVTKTLTANDFTFLICGGLNSNKPIPPTLPCKVPRQSYWSDGLVWTIPDIKA